MDNRPIGVFDSGVGGISVLGEALTVLPYEQFIYLGDTAHVPFGNRPLDEIITFTRDGVYQLLQKYQCKAILIACNTATSAAADALRSELSVPIIGIEPALKPASMISGDGYVVVMATQATLMLPKFLNLMERFGEKAIPLPCPGLVEFVEAGNLHGEELRTLLTQLLKPVQSKPIKAVVLGCTHYPFLQEEIAAFFSPNVSLIDGGYGTACQLRRKLTELELLTDSVTVKPPILLSTAAGQDRTMRNMLDWWQIHHKSINDRGKETV